MRFAPGSERLPNTLSQKQVALSFYLFARSLFASALLLHKLEAS